MSSLSKLIQLWNNDRFVPGGQTVSNSLPSDNQTKRERFTKLHHDRTIVRDIRDGIAILGHAVDGLEKTQEFNRDSSVFKGNAREILMSDDFLMVAHVLRLIFPEGMMSELRPRKRGRDEVDDDDDNNHEEGGTRKYRPILIPKGSSQLVPRPKQGPYTGMFKSIEPERSNATFSMNTIKQPEGGLFQSIGSDRTGITLSFSDLKTDEQAGHHTSSTSGSDSSKKPLSTEPVFSSSGFGSSGFGSSGFGSSSFKSSEKPLSTGGFSLGNKTDKEPEIPKGPLFKIEKPLSTGGFSLGNKTDKEPEIPKGPLFKIEKPLSTGGFSLGNKTDKEPGIPKGPLFKIEKPLSTGGLSSVKTKFSGFGNSGFSSLEKPLSTADLGNNKELDTYKQAPLPTGPSFSDLKVSDGDKSPDLAGLEASSTQILEQSHKEELNTAVQARKGEDQGRSKLETPQDLISF